MFDPWLLLLLVVAIAIGWVLGRRSYLLSEQKKAEASLYQPYYKGLNFLFSEEPDAALDTFIESLAVNSETLETHIAVGNLMRRKGEVERAIRIHQNLLARPSLPNVHLHQAHLELARDFISAGLLDRAERLLQDLLNTAPELSRIAMRHLLEIYQDEKEWQRAIDIGRQLLPRKTLLKAVPATDGDVGVALSHYCCELAELALEKNDYRTARHWLKQALGYDRECARASLLAAEAEFDTGNYSAALRTLRKMQEQDPVFLSEAITLVKNCYQQMGRPEDYHAFLMENLEEYPSTSLLLALVDDIQSRQGDVAAAEYIGAQLKRRPSLKGLAKLVELHVTNSEGRARENLKILQLLIQQLLQNKPSYKCRHCGFSGKHLHWLCPSCKHWGQMKAIRGAEGD